MAPMATLKLFQS